MRIKKILITSLIFAVLITNLSLGNIIPEIQISEFLIDSTGWKLEIASTRDTLKFDSTTYLTSLEDTAYFKDDNIFYDTTDGENWKLSNLALITSKNLKSDLHINYQQDTIKLHDSRYSTDHFKILLSLAYGFSNFPPPPAAGQSLCFNDGSAYFAYLDNSPTPGHKNDTLDATGNLNIKVQDSKNDPVVKIYCYRFYSPGATYYIADSSDSQGNLKLNLISGPHELYFSPCDSLQDLLKYSGHSKYVTKNTVIYPETSQSMTVQIPDSLLTQIHQPEPTKPISHKYKLSDNYPNPFNNSTSFTYQIPINDYVEINLYDINGRKINTIDAGFQKAGKHRVEIKFTDLSSGIFFYSLETGNRKITKKCMYLK
jgi:hypothetical protein